MCTLVFDKKYPYARWQHFMVANCCSPVLLSSYASWSSFVFNKHTHRERERERERRAPANLCVFVCLSVREKFWQKSFKGTVHLHFKFSGLKLRLPTYTICGMRMRHALYDLFASILTNIHAFRKTFDPFSLRKPVWVVKFKIQPADLCSDLHSHEALHMEKSIFSAFANRIRSSTYGIILVRLHVFHVLSRSHSHTAYMGS